MATLSDDEIYRIKSLLFEHVLDIGADVYIGNKSIFSVVRDHVVSSSVAVKTCSTTVSASGATMLTLDAVTGLVVNSRVQIDVDAQRETCSIKGISGLGIYVNCTKLHSGMYPVEVESGLTIVRGLVSDLIAVEQGRYQDVMSSNIIKRADEVEFRDNQFEALQQVQEFLRRELASATGLMKLYMSQRSGGNPGSVEMY